MTAKILLPLAAVGALAGTAVAASPRDTLHRHRISWTEKQGAVQTGATANLFLPESWQQVRSRDDRHLSFREGSAACRYSVTFTSRLAADTAETPAEYVASALPQPAANRIIDFGTRGTAAAWRVTHPAATDGRVHLQALRADRQLVAPGRHMWREVWASAVSRKGSECHSGTYRNVLGPQIGDALATATGRAYTFTARHR